jgi:hypothetical protein
MMANTRVEEMMSQWPTAGGERAGSPASGEEEKRTLMGLMTKEDFERRIGCTDFDLK